MGKDFAKKSTKRRGIADAEADILLRMLIPSSRGSSATPSSCSCLGRFSNALRRHGVLSEEGGEERGGVSLDFGNVDRVGHCEHTYLKPFLNLLETSLR
jgi:hypothetical protein